MSTCLMNALFVDNCLKDPNNCEFNAVKPRFWDTSWSAANGIPESRLFKVYVHELILLSSKTHSRSEVIPELSIPEPRFYCI